MRKFFGFWGRALWHSFSFGWIVFGAMSTLMPAVIALTQKWIPSWAGIGWMKWISNYQVELQVGIALVFAITYLVYAPYRLHKQVSDELTKTKRLLAESPLTGIRLRNECDKWIESGKALYERLHGEGGEAAIPEAKRWLYDFKEFTELNLSVSDFDAVHYSNKAPEVFDAELAKLKPSHAVQTYKNLLAHRFGRLSVIRNNIK
jgi:hypothetical protein